MEKLKLLLIMKDYSSWGNAKKSYLARELSEIADVVFWYEPGHIDDILKQIRFTPDFILIFFYKSREDMSPPITGLNTLKIPFGININDLHNLNNFKDSIIEDNVKHIFSCYRDSFIKNYPEFMDRMIWLPHAVNTKIFKDYKFPKEIDMLLMGRVSKKYYPLRDKILKTLSGKENFVHHKHPGSREVKNKKNALVREKYAKEINKAKIFFTCDSVFQYPVLKYYEVLACNTLLLASDSPELYDLGFRDGENFVAINEHNFLEKAEYYLNHDQERERISMNGYKFVHKKHSIKMRARELVKMIEEILAKKNV